MFGDQQVPAPGSANDWVILEPTSAPSSIHAPVRLSINQQGSGFTGRVLVSLSILRQIVRREIVPGEEITCHVKLGKGVNSHQLAIQPDGGGLFKAKPFRNRSTAAPKTYIIYLPRIDHWQAKLRQAAVEHEIVTGNGKLMLVINLPRGFWNQRK